MEFAVLVSTVLLLAGQTLQDGIDYNDPAIKYTPKQMILSQGYFPEEHTVTTDDGYILTLHRIPAARDQMPDKTAKKQPFLLWHGLEGCSTNYIDQLYYESLGFILADQGYDVWIGNSRGNTYSKKHIKGDDYTTKPEYWAFSWDEMAKYDLPNSIDYILGLTGYDKLYYVGHSQGTTIMFAMCSDHPDYCKQKVKGFFPLAPVARVAHMSSSLVKIAQYTTIIDEFAKVFGLNDFLPSNGILKKIQDDFCHDPHDSDAYKVCTNLVYLLVGDKMDKNQNMTRLGVYLAHNPAGTSTQDIAHWGQGVMQGQFQKYDYQEWWGLTNWFHYGHLKPPIYEVSNLNVPTYFFRGSLDTTSNPTDDAWLASQLSDDVLICNFFFQNYTHTDFIWSETAYKDVYPYILRNVKEIESAEIEGRKMNCMVNKE